MLYKALFSVAPLTLGGLVYSGTIPLSAIYSSSGVSETVPEPVDMVAAAISDLHLNEVGVDASSGVSLAGRRTAGAYTWTLYWGGKPVANMVANLEQREGGKATRVTSEVIHLPAAQDPGMPHGVRDLGTLGTVFAAALEEELNSLRPEGARLSAEEATKARHGKMVTATAIHTLTHQKEIMVDLDAMANEWKKRDAEDEQSWQAADAGAGADASVTFEAGRPMVDASRPMVEVGR